MQRLPCSEVLQRRSSADGLEKRRLGLQLFDRSAQGHLLGKWHGFEEDGGVSPDSLRVDLRLMVCVSSVYFKGTGVQPLAGLTSVRQKGGLPGPSPP